VAIRCALPRCMCWRAGVAPPLPGAEGPNLR
jgi:hypothetical protein